MQKKFDGWDCKKAHSLPQGHKVRKFTHKNSLISRGGIGSGNPHIEPMGNGVDIYDPAGKFIWQEGDLRVI